MPSWHRLDASVMHAGKVCSSGPQTSQCRPFKTYSCNVLKDPSYAQMVINYVLGRGQWTTTTDCCITCMRQAARRPAGLICSNRKLFLPCHFAPMHFLVRCFASVACNAPLMKSNQFNDWCHMVPFRIESIIIQLLAIAELIVDLIVSVTQNDEWPRQL